MFNDIQKEIERTISERKVQGPNPNLNGTIVSVPGTEKVVLSTSIADFITCTAVGTGPKAKERYCIVHKDQQLKYNGQYCDSNGHPISIVPKLVFDTMITILSSTNKRIQDLKRDLDRANVDRESYKMTLDALRKNGVID
jgi:hypothetical protein